MRRLLLPLTVFPVLAAGCNTGGEGTGSGPVQAAMAKGTGDGQTGHARCTGHRPAA